MLLFCNKYWRRCCQHIEAAEKLKAAKEEIEQPKAAPGAEQRASRACEEIVTGENTRDSVCARDPAPALFTVEICRVGGTGAISSRPGALISAHLNSEPVGYGGRRYAGRRCQDAVLCVTSIHTPATLPGSAVDI